MAEQSSTSSESKPRRRGGRQKAPLTGQALRDALAAQQVEASPTQQKHTDEPEPVSEPQQPHDGEAFRVTPEQGQGGLLVGADLVDAGAARAETLPQLLVVEGTGYVRHPDGAFRDRTGAELDLHSPAAAGAYHDWMMAQHTPAPAPRAAEPAEGTPENPVTEHQAMLDPDVYEALLDRRRGYLRLSEVRPGVSGPQGVRSGHSVRCRPAGGASGVHLWVTVTDEPEDGVVSVVPAWQAGSKSALVVTMKPHHRAWLEAVAAVRGETAEYVATRILAAAWQNDPVRNATGAGSGMASSMDGTVAADLRAGRMATQQSKGG